MKFIGFTDEEYNDALEVLDNLLSKGIGQLFANEDELPQEEIVEPRLLNIGGKNYEVVELVNDEGPKLFFVHDLVAITYIPNPNNFIYVKHKNGDTLDNCADNLEWTSECPY